MKSFNLNKVLLKICLITFIFQSGLAQAGDIALVPLPSLDDFTRGENGLAFGLGIGIEYESAYEGSDEFGLEVDPAGALQYRLDNHILYWAGEAFGWRGLISKKWLIETVIGFEEGREESASEDGHLNGLGNGEESLEFVIQTKHALDSDWRYWIDARIVTGEKGKLGLIGVGRRFGDQKDGTGHEFSMAAVFHDKDYANKDFGINQTQSSASGLRQTSLRGGFRSIGLNYNFRKYVSKNWQIFSEAVYEGYSNEIKDSPITRKDFEAEVGVGLIFIF